MKKIICILTSALLLVGLSSCRKEPDFVDEVTKYIPNEPSAPVTEQTQAQDTAQPNGTADVTPSFTAASFTEETEHSKVTVKYPIVSNITNAEAVNRIIYDTTYAFVMNDISYTFVGETFGSYEIDSVNMTYADDLFLSFVYTGSYYAEGAAHPVGFIRTLNVDVNNARILDESEIFSDFGKLHTYFEDGVFTQVSSGNAELDAERALLERADLIGQYRAEYGLYPPAYFVMTESGTELAFSAETVYALGNHIEFTADIAYVGDCLTEQILKLTKGTK